MSAAGAKTQASTPDICVATVNGVCGSEVEKSLAWLPLRTRYLRDVDCGPRGLAVGMTRCTLLAMSRPITVSFNTLVDARKGDTEQCHFTVVLSCVFVRTFNKHHVSILIMLFYSPFVNRSFWARVFFVGLHD